MGLDLIANINILLIALFYGFWRFEVFLFGWGEMYPVVNVFKSKVFSKEILVEGI